MLACYAVDWGSIPGRVIPDLRKSTCCFAALTFSTLGKSMGVNQIALPDGQPSTVAFNVLTQLCDPKANETKMATALFTKNGEGWNFDYF